MNKAIAPLVFAMIFSIATFAIARDTHLQFPVENALNSVNIKNELYSNIKLFWGDQEHPKTKTVIGEYKTSQRTNALGKSKEDACNWALASCLKQLQSRALQEGGDALVNIKSNIKNVEKSSQTEYECLAGSVMVNVALKGTVVKLAE